MPWLNRKIGSSRRVKTAQFRARLIVKRGGMVLLDGAIMLYQLSLSPWLGPVCRYEPTCSHYARAAFRLHGFRKGGKMALRRVLSCRPGGGYGFDPVPMPSATSPAMAAKKIPHRLGQPE